jgi:hypothetical protein
MGRFPHRDLLPKNPDHPTAQPNPFSRSNPRARRQSVTLG